MIEDNPDNFIWSHLFEEDMDIINTVKKKKQKIRDCSSQGHKCAEDK